MARNILIVDDDNSFSAEVGKRLSHTYTIATADNARDALNRLAGENFDIVILDMNLRDTAGDTVDSDRFGGVKVLQKLSQRNQGQQVSRSIFMSSYTVTDVVELAAGEGCRYFMFKSLKDDNEGAFYEILSVYIDSIEKDKRFKNRLLITIGVSTIIMVGVAMAYFGKSSVAGLMVSSMGLALNLLSFYPKSLR